MFWLFVLGLIVAGLYFGADWLLKLGLITLVIPLIIVVVAITGVAITLFIQSWRAVR